MNSNDKNYLSNFKEWKFAKPKIDHSRYIDIWRDILKPNPWCRNLILITGRGTGKSKSSREPMLEFISTTSNDENEINSIRANIASWIGDIIKSNYLIRCSWIRDTETAIRTSVVNKFESIFNKPTNWDTKKGGEWPWKVNNNGVFHKNDPIPRIAFIGLNTPWNYLDSGLCCRYNVYDEIISYSISIDDQEKQNTIPDFENTFADVYQGITRPYYRNNNLDDIPYLIMLGNPRRATTTLYSMFEWDPNWNKANRIDIIDHRKRFRFIGMWLSKFNIKEMKMSLGHIGDIGNNYPKMKEIDKRIIYWYKVKKIFTPEFGITYNRTNYAIGFIEWNEIQFMYVLELPKNTDYMTYDIKYYCYSWEHKQPHNIFSQEIFLQFKSYHKRSAIIYSSEYAQQQLEPLCVRIIMQNKD